MSTATSTTASDTGTIDDGASVLDAIEAPHFSAPTPITQEIAVVLDVASARDAVAAGEGGAGKVAVRVGERQLDAQRAVSCLVSPEKGDRVLVALTPDGPFVLAVLWREDALPTTVSTPSGDLRVQVPGGRFSVATRDGVDVATRGEIRLAAVELGATVERAKLYAEEIVALGAKALVEVAQAKLKGSTLESVFDRTLSRVKRSFRNVEEIDTVRAGDIDYKAEASLGLRSQNTVMTAKELIKADAEQIHFG